MTVVGSEVKSSPIEDDVENYLYVGLCKEHRVSRTFRATWYLRNLNKAISPSQNMQQECSEGDEAEDVCVLGVNGHHMVTTDTQVFYICQQYSLVFVLDMSPNMTAVSNTSYSMKIEKAVSSLCACLTLLTQPYSVADKAVLQEPKLCVTVLAFCGATAEKPIYIFVQGVYVNRDNCPELINSLKVSINKFENHLTTESTKTKMDGSGGGDVTLEGMIRAGTLGIQLLPRSALKGVILLTDGISGFSNPSSMHNTVSSMCCGNISCWVVHIGGSPHPSDALGLVPDIDMLNFVTRACNGCVMQPDKILCLLEGLKEGVEPNPVQQAILFWSFQLSAFCTRVKEVVGEGWTVTEDPFAPIIHRIFTKGTISAPVLCVVGCKIREGFILKELHMKDSVLEICLCYPWQPSVNICYTISVPWPVSDATQVLHVTTSYDGPYLFMQDINGHYESGTPISSYRLTAIRKFRQALQKFSSSDAVLAHFLSFSFTPSLHTLPNSVQDGVPLFHLLPGSTKPVPSLGTGVNKPSPLHQFWRSLCTIDSNQWYRWFHSDKVVLVLHPEQPFPRNLLQQSASGRYGSPLCRPAASYLFEFLKGWSSLVLLDSQYFIRFLPSNNQPRYFCLVRVAQKHPCVVLHIGHIEGTPHSLQSDTVTSLLKALKNLSPVGKERSATPNKKKSSGVSKGKPVLTIISKQLQRIMIRYEVAGQSGALSSLTSQVTGETSERLIQMDYLKCHSWVWLLPSPTPAILTALLQYRLKEGYHVTSAHNGVVTLAAQLSVKQTENSADTQQLLLQYVVFPYGETLRSELWVEPQYGTICDGSLPLLRCLRDLTYSEISSKVHAEDMALVTEVGSFVHLLQSCQAGQSNLETSVAQKEVAVGLEPSVINFQMSSLFRKSRVFATTFRGFSTVASASSSSLEEWSPLSHKFLECFNAHLRTLAPTEVMFSDSHSLIQRLQSSNKLQDFFSLVDFGSSAQSVKWTCHAVSHATSVMIFFLPWGFYSFPLAGDSEMAALIPLILVQCSQAHMLDPNASGSQEADKYFQFELSGHSPEFTDLDECTSELFSSLSSFHTSSYLQLLQSGLTQGLSVSCVDFLTGLKICKQSTLSVDVTPLLSALCSHAKVTLSSLHSDSSVPPLKSELLCQLLSAALSKLEWTSSVQLAEEEGADEWSSICHRWKQEINSTFKRHLEKMGFKRVDQCGASYFWLDEDSHRKSPQSDSTSTRQEFLLPHPHPMSSTPTDLSKELHLPLEEEEEEEEEVVEKKQEKGEENEEKDQENDLIVVLSDTESSEGELGMDLVPLLSPAPGESETSGREINAPVIPLFLQVKCSLRDKDGGWLQDLSLMDSMYIPTCLEMLAEGVTDGDSYTVSVDFVFSSQLESTKEKGQSALSALPGCYHSVATSLQYYLQWLICDELVSMGRLLEPISPALLQSVATHVQTSHNSSHTCYAQHVPLKFIFGEINSMTHFVHQLEALDIPGHSLVKMDEYYYLEPKSYPSNSAHHGDLTPDLLSSQSDDLLSFNRPRCSQSVEHDLERSKTPPPPQSTLGVLRTHHRRALSSGYPIGYAPVSNITVPPASNCGSEVDVRTEVVTTEVGSGYEAGQSDDTSSTSEGMKVSISKVLQGMETQAWMVLRILSSKVDIYFQFRSSKEVKEVILSDLKGIYDQVLGGVKRTCHRTNQWFLLKEMLETHACSPYLLLESASEAWVEEVVRQQGKAEPFGAQEFMCDLVHSFYITPHSRVKERKAQAGLQTTRHALGAFAVTNRRDVYVLQDVKATGEESIFYVKIYESLCNVQESITADVAPFFERSDTGGTNDGMETLSTLSLQQSISEVADMERKGSGMEILPFHRSQGKPQESLVLQVHGITQPSQEFQDRLRGIIQRKLDATALDIICNLYARNTQVKLTPEDVEFLQPSHKPSHTLYLPLPNWPGQDYQQTFFFYFLQTLSTLALYPTYVSSENKEHFQFQAHQELQNAYLVENLSNEILQDHLFLYIRPQTKGRGMAVVCVSLVEPSGKVTAPVPGSVTSLKGSPSHLDQNKLECAVSEEISVSGGYSIKLHIWEKGNIGLEEFMHKLSLCFKHSMLDYYLEIYLLPSPVARYIPELDGGGSEGCGLVEGDASSITLESSTEDSPSKEISSPWRNQSMINPQRSLKRESVTSLRSLDSSRRDSDTFSRRTSESFSRRSSAKGSDSSRKGSATYSESRRSSAEKGAVSNSDRIVHSLSHMGAEEFSQPFRFTEQVIEEKDELAENSLESSLSSMGGRRGGGNGGHEVYEGETSSSPWLQREKIRRIDETREALITDAGLGKTGQLDVVFENVVPHHLSLGHGMGAPSLKHIRLPLMGQYSGKIFVSKLVSALKSACPDLSTDVFQLGPSGFVHSTPQEDYSKLKKKPADIGLPETEFVVISRNLVQWEDSHCSTRTTHAQLQSQDFSHSLQLFNPLDSRKPHLIVPLHMTAKIRDIFVPRRRLIFMKFSQLKVDIWLYNLSDQLAKRVCDRLTTVRDWQAARSGLLQHLLTQKMGLFRHCQGQDLQGYVKLTSKKCSTMKETVALIKNNIIPVDERQKRPIIQQLQRPFLVHGDHISIESVYLEQMPYSPVETTEDPVFNHGQQFRDWHVHQRDLFERQGLLGKVFASWESRGGEAGAPVSSAIIADLKKVARLLHYCTSPLLIYDCTSNTQTQPSPDAKSQAIRERLFSQYIKYLNSLGFQAINERTSTKPKSSSRVASKTLTSSLPHSFPHWYKCLQRSWPGGIVMVELMFQDKNFLVKLYTLERSRLGQPLLSPEDNAVFAQECARYKDFIHVHSFMCDFHLKLLLDLLTGTQPFPEGFHLRNFLKLCHKHSSPPPNFIRNLLKRGSIRVPASVEPDLLYSHLVSHCDKFHAKTLALQGVGGRGDVQSSAREIGLLIDVSKQSLGPTTSPEFSRLMEETEANYSIKILVMYTDPDKSTDNVRYLELVFYLLLVNKEDIFPRLTCSGPHLRASCHPLPPNTPQSEPGAEESDLHLKVMEHRRKMGFGSLATPSAASQIVLDRERVDQQMHGVQTHLEAMIQKALHNMRKDELWKRMVYGIHEGRSSFEKLTYSDFRDLLYMVTECPLEELDPNLSQLKRQPRKWFRKLIQPLEARFTEDIRVYTSDDGTHTYAAIVNPGWHDMLVLVQSGATSQQVSGISAVYRKPKEGGVPLKERPITANLEADRQHIETVINFCCCFMWASILDSAPPLPSLNLL